MPDDVVRRHHEELAVARAQLPGEGYAAILVVRRRRVVRVIVAVLTHVQQGSRWNDGERHGARGGGPAGAAGAVGGPRGEGPGSTCPVHYVGPWRVVVIGETRESMRLQVYGCCERIGAAVTAMVRADPRVASPS